MNVFIFGGSFNPPHVAHVLAISYVLATEDVDLVLVVPCYRHAFAKELLPFEDRMVMCEKAIGFLPRTEISRIEEELGGESRTLRTVKHLQEQHPDWRMRVVLGADVLLESERWQGFAELVAIAPPLILGRPGVEAAGAPRALLPDVSSTAIRSAIRDGRPHEIAHLLPRGVLDYIETHGFFRAS